MKPLKRLKWVGVALGLLVAGFASAQLVRPERTNFKADPSHTIRANFASSDVGSVLDRACGECHSNATTSRWYTKVSPFSLVIARGAREGRMAVNFAEWITYSPAQQHAFLIASCADARAGKMPMPAYLRFRPDAKLSSRDIDTICGASR